MLKKIIQFVGANLNKVEELHAKITKVYSTWTKIYEAIKPLLPSQVAAEVAESMAEAFSEPVDASQAPA